MRNKINQKTFYDNQNFVLFINIYKYKHLYNKITQPHNRGLIYNSSLLNSDKFNRKVISEI